MRIIPIILFIALFSCSGERTPSGDFTDRVLDLTIETSDGEYLQFPKLYDTLTGDIPDDKDEKLLLVERLKAKGFEVVTWGRGNYPPLGVRIISYELKRDDCVCEVNKVYYRTLSDTLYQMVEGISCTRRR
ncbi:MAG: hypothetical protein ACOYXT_03235 [Bacteroidota bacterium]